MRQTSRTLKPGLLALALLLAACGGGGDEGGGASIAGTYSCGPEGEGPQETWELRDDGTLTIDSPGGTVEGTWSAEGDSLLVTIEGQENRFTIEGDGFEGRIPRQPARWVCTRA
jgi:hypothetical protein